MHGADCIAEDCYSTDVSFSFKLGDTLFFPEKVQFREHEHGCVDKETRISSFFQLKELNADLVIYRSDKYNRTLVLFRADKKSGAYAFYFTKVGPERINGKNVYKIRDKYNEEDKILFTHLQAGFYLRMNMRILYRNKNLHNLGGHYIFIFKKSLLLKAEI